MARWVFLLKIFNSDSYHSAQFCSEYMGEGKALTTWSQECSESETSSDATTQEWLDLGILAKQKKIHVSSPSSHTQNFANVCEDCRIYVKDPPPLLTFETAPDTVPNHLPSPFITLSTKTNTIEYKLHSIIYYSQFHFSARLFDDSQNIWPYNSQKNNGIPG